MIRLFLLSLLSFILVACGGAGEEVATTSDTTDTTDDSTTLPVSIGLGSGTGTDFEESTLQLSSSYVLTGNRVTVTASAVDKNDSNNALSDTYYYQFESVCAGEATPLARFTTETTFNANGSVSSTYINDGCTITDTLTVSLFADDTSKTALATASASLPVVAPVLGSGSGADFRSGDIEGDLALVGTAETLLTANAVDPNGPNGLIADEIYSALWVSSCEDGSFSVASQTLATGTISTRYDGNLTSCLGDNTLTLSLVLTGDTTQVLDTAETVVNISTSSTGGEEVEPGLGTGTGAEFSEGNLGLSLSRAVTGQEVTVSASVVDKNSANAALTDSTYLYVFSSTCSDQDPQTASFANPLQTVSTGSASGVYTISATGCSGTDTIRVDLYSSGADPEADTALASATAELEVGIPLLGIGEGADFRLGEVSGETSLTSVEETLLTANAVNPLTSNSLVSGSEYSASWTSDCPVGVFSIGEQDLTNSSISTRYTSSLDECLGANNLTLSLYWQDVLLGSMDVVVTLQDEATNEEVEEAIGFGTGAEFQDGVLDLEALQVLVGELILVSVDGVDLRNGNASLADEYKYAFSSTCADLGDASFSISEVNTTTNSVTTAYRNLSCTDSDVITAYLYQSSAEVGVDAPLDTASQTIDVALPLLGTGEGASFDEGAVDGELALSGEDETEFSLTLVNPLNSNALVQSEALIVEWASDCDDASFSVQRQNLSTGLINTRYTTDTTSCLGTNQIDLILYESNNSCGFDDTSACMAHLTFEVSVSQGIAPELGYVDDTPTYYSGELLVNGVRESEYDGMTAEELEAATLSARGTALIEVNVVDTNNSNEVINGTSYGYVISSDCVSDGIASFTESERISSSGTANFTYTSETCESDNFEVELFRVVDGAMTTSLDSFATGILNIHPIEIGAISYSGATATAISIATIGDAVLPKQTILTFVVVDESGNPVESKEVDFEITNVTGGSSLSTDSDVTDDNGEVNVILNAGTSHAITSVKATTLSSDGTTEISTFSQPISITTGIADQDSFDLVVDISNPGSYNTNNVALELTVSASDQYQNPVADGTIVNFTAESGSIESSCTTISGTCSVTWLSSGIRPGNHDTDLDRVNELDPQLGTDVPGMTTILAYTTGEGGYTDTNGNGQFDSLDAADEPFVTFHEAFREDNNWPWEGAIAPDTNGDGLNVEFFADFDNDEEFDPAPLTYQGVVCSDSALANGHCASLMHVRDSVRIVQSVGNVAPVLSAWVFQGGAYIETGFTCLQDMLLGLTTNCPGGVTATRSFYVLVQDANGNMPATGTSLSVSGDGYEIFGDSGEVGNSIGLLYNSDLGHANGLPSFGQLYSVQYLEEDDPVSIEIEASLDGLSSGVTLVR